MSDRLMEYGRGSNEYELLPDNQHSNGLATSIVIAGAHQLVGLLVNNTNASAQFVLGFDLRAVPSNGAVPVFSLTVPGASDKGVVWLPPRKMLEGIVLANSSTAATLTIGAADCFYDVQFC